MKNESHHHHQHSHAGGAHHHHSHSVFGRMRFAFALNLGFAVIELVGGIMTNSVAILSDALHDFGDALAMLIALGLEKLSLKQSDAAYSYGYRRFSTLGAVITGMILIFGSCLILVEAVPRLFHPEQPSADGMIGLAILGLTVNGYAAYRISKGSSLNERMLMWHMMEDVAGWALVLIGALVMKFFDLPQIDAGLAICLSLWILFNVFKNLREAMKVFLMAAPPGVSLPDVTVALRGLNQVKDVHHVHIWSLDGENHILTAHLVVAAEVSHAEVSSIKMEAKKMLQRFGIGEATIETELQGSACADPQHG